LNLRKVETGKNKTKPRSTSILQEIKQDYACAAYQYEITYVWCNDFKLSYL